jgi:anaerobic dimethyl sulfoxide reductase subunit B (iron-sulfur subunit)
MTQYGFFIDLSRCTGCNACVIACKQWHAVPTGPVKWMRVHQWERGSFPNINIHVMPVMCFHCESPSCLKACPSKAITKEEKYGAVLVDSEKCTGERKCWKACPYGAPQFENDGPGKMSKCNMCIDRLEKGDKPICVLSCSLRALEFGPIDELKKKYGEQAQMEEMPKNSITRPAAVWKPMDPKKQIVPWDWKKTLQLWQKRHPDDGEELPPVFDDIDSVTRDSGDIVGRSKLVLKPAKAEDKMAQTTDDE